MAVTPFELRGYTFPNVIGRRARDRADHSFLLFEDERYSYADVHAITNRLANGLLAAGIRHGDHVALLLDNSPAIVWYYLALGKIGAVSVPLNTAAKGELLARFLRQSQACCVVVGSDILQRVTAAADQCPALRLKIVVRAPATDTHAETALGSATFDHASLLEHDVCDTGAKVDFKDLACLMFTSGTTGPSKAIMWGQSGIFEPAAAISTAFGYGPDEVMYTCLPLFHGNAMRSLYVAMVSGCTIALARRFSASAFWDDVRRFQATQFNLLGAMANILWNRTAETQDRAHAARKCMIVPVPSFGAGFAERFDVRICSTYALTDFAYISFLRPDDPVDKWTTAGRVQPDMEVAIVDEDDLPLASGKVGEICVRNRRPWITAQGYFGMPEATVTAWRNLWFHTGDRGFLDADGYLHFSDRKKDSIRRRGENISSFEVEQLIALHPDVGEVAAFAVRSDMTEDEVMVSVVKLPESTLTEEELVRWCAKEMAYFMVPRYVQFVETLPRTLTEKIEKYKLRSDAEQDLERVWDRQRHGVVVSR